MPRPSLPSFPPDVAASWERVRRYAVPASMIEAATERRLAGDWRGACAAAGVDVDIDLAEAAEHYGKKTARELEEDLRHLAPDLVRWHLPRREDGRTTLLRSRTVVLASYRRRGRSPKLYLATPGTVDGPQRLLLRFDQAPWIRDRGPWLGWTELRPLWDVRHLDGLREWYGGGDRIPFFHPDGTPLAGGELPTADPGPRAPAAHTEWVTLLHDRGEVPEAFAAAGIALEEPEISPILLESLAATGVALRLEASDFSPILIRDVDRRLASLPLAPTRLRRLVLRHPGRRLSVPVRRHVFLVLETRGSRKVRGWFAAQHEVEDLPAPAEAGWRRPPDLDLLRLGRIGPDDLHPLIRDALFPARGAAPAHAGPPAPRPPAPVNVRCRGRWHQVRSEAHGLRIPHDEDEQRRESALHALGGPATGCFAVRRAWNRGDGWLPRGLREQRRELFLRAQHGDVAGVLALLDAGFDPRVRDGRRRTLLHALNLLDHEPLLPRLLAAGLDLEARDHLGRTPLHVAVGEHGSPALVDALLAAGARTDVVDDRGRSLRHLVERLGRSDLAELRERGERERPDRETGR